MEKNLVSVVIPTYKRSDTLERAIDSVLNQTYKSIEIIIVDDNNPNSMESSLVKEKLKKYKKNENVKYISQKKHINGAVARNIGIKNAKGEYIAFLDDDDEWNPLKIELQLKYMLENNLYGVSCLYEIKNKNKVIRKCKAYNGKKLHKKVISRQISIFTSTILLKRNILDITGYFNENLIRHQDLQLLLDYLYEYQMGVLNKYLVTLHSDSEINHPKIDRMIEVKKEFFKICSKHLEKYSNKEQNNILAAHYFEIILIALKQKKILIIIKYLIKIGFNLEAYKEVILRYKNR